MDEIELVEKCQGAERLDGQVQKDPGPFVTHGFNDVPPLDELQGEARQS